MGMGEPFHNEDGDLRGGCGVARAELFHYPPRRILISTVGIPDAMIRSARRFPRINLALSLHSVRQSVREQIDSARGKIFARRASSRRGRYQ